MENTTDIEINNEELRKISKIKAYSIINEYLLLYKA